jgi:hypothetical protein
MLRKVVFQLLGFVFAVLAGGIFSYLSGTPGGVVPSAAIGAPGNLTAADLGGLVSVGLIYAIVAAIWVFLIRLLLGVKRLRISWIMATAIALALIGYPLWAATYM